jgi:hypothetical protein
MSGTIASSVRRVLGARGLARRVGRRRDRKIKSVSSRKRRNVSREQGKVKKRRSLAGKTNLN